MEARNLDVNLNTAFHRWRCHLFCLRGGSNGVSLFFCPFSLKKFCKTKITPIFVITKQTDMEDHTIELNEHTWLEVEYEIPAGESGSYDTPPSDPFISIQKITLVKTTHRKRLKRLKSSEMMVWMIRSFRLIWG